MIESQVEDHVLPFLGHTLCYSELASENPRFIHVVSLQHSGATLPGWIPGG